MRCLLLMLAVVASFSQLAEAVGSELDPNQIKPSDVKIEQKRVFANKVRSNEDHAKVEINTDTHHREEGKIADAGIIDSEAASHDQPSLNSWEITSNDNTPEDIEERRTEQLQEQLESKQHEAQMEQLPEWIRAEQQPLPNLETPSLLEQFHFTLDDSSSISFVLDSTNKTNTDNRIYLQFFIYTLSDSNQYTVPNRPAQATHLQLTVSPTVDPSIGQRRNIYVHSRMQVPTRPIYHLHFLNFYDRKIYVIARVEFMKQRITPISKEHIDPTAGSLAAIAESFRIKKVTYKWDMGFKEQAELHQNTLLWLTGFELFALVVTTVLQVSCLKRLIDNRSIV